MNVRFKMAYLTEGKDMFGPQDGAATVMTNTRTGFSKDCPNLGKFLSNLAFNVEAEDLLMSYILDEGMAPREAGARWLKDNPAVLEGWLRDVTTVDGQPALPAAQKALGL